MNKVAVAGMLLMSSALLVGCASTAAPNPQAPKGGTAADGRAQTRAIGPLQWVPSREHNGPLQAKVQAIPGAEHAHVYVNGQNAFVVLNYMVSDGPDTFPTDKTVPSHGTTANRNLVRTPSATGPTGTGMYMVHPSIYGTPGNGLHAERPHYTGGVKEQYGQKGSKAGVTNTNGITPLHQRISETILSADPSIHNVYFVQQMR